MAGLIQITSELYDNFRQTAVFPKQCVLSPIADMRVAYVEFVCGNYLAKWNIYNLMSDSCVPLPIPPYLTDPATVDMEVNIYDAKNDLIKNLNTKINITGNTMVYPGSSHLDDSMYNRMLPGINIADTEKTRLPHITPVSDYAGIGQENAMERLFDYLSNYTLIATRNRKYDMNGHTVRLLSVPSLLETTDLEEGSRYSLGLLFCHCAAEAGYHPIYILKNDACIVGLEVGSTFDSGRIKTRRLSSKIGRGVPRTFRYALLDMSEWTSLGLSSAVAFERTADLRGARIINFELEREKYMHSRADRTAKLVYEGKVDELV